MFSFQNSAPSQLQAIRLTYPNKIYRVSAFASTKTANLDARFSTDIDVLLLLLKKIAFATLIEQITVKLIARWRNKYGSDRAVSNPRQNEIAVDNALTLFRVWPIENVGAIFGHASAAAQRITCLVAGFKRLFCSIRIKYNTNTQLHIVSCFSAT